MKGNAIPRAGALLVLAVALGCTQLKTVSSPTVPTTPTGDTPASDTTDVPDPPAFESPAATPTPAPTATPVPPARIVMVAPAATDDFTAEAVDVSFTVTPAEGRTIAKVTLAYDGAVLKTFNEGGPTYKLEDWNPNLTNSTGDEPDTTPVKAGDHKLVVTATDDQGKTSRLEFSFEKPLKITGWEAVTSLPQPVSHAFAFPDGAAPPGFLTMWGSMDGVETSLVPRTQVFSFNPAGMGSFTEINVTGTAVPRGAYGAALHPGGTIAYLVGGRVGTTDVNTIDVLSPLRKVAEANASGLADARRDPAVAYLDDFVYAIGGKRVNSPLYSVERIAIAQDGNPTGSWAKMADLQNARAGANAYVHGKEIWLFGGGFKPIEIYDARTNQWRFMTGKDNAVIGTPEGWANSLMVPVRDRLFFFGGTREDGQAMDAIYEFALKTKTWRKVGPLPALEAVADADRPETRMTGFFLGGHFYLLGGMSVPEGKITDKVFRATTL